MTYYFICIVFKLIDLEYPKYALVSEKVVTRRKKKSLILTKKQLKIVIPVTAFYKIWIFGYIIYILFILYSFSN